MLNLGVIGYGYWGPNIVRNFSIIKELKIHTICDSNSDSLKKASILYPNVKFTNNYREVTSDIDIDAVAIVTPVFTHYEIAKESLNNGKHIFIEKPFTSTVEQATELIELAEKKNLQIMVDHTFLFTGAVKKIKQLIDNDELGNLLYLDSTRVNLGLFQHDINVIWDLAPHDFSILDYFIKEMPVKLFAHGMEHFGRGLEDIAYVTMYYNNNMIAHFSVNWMSPVKVRNTFIGGSKKMLLWNDIEPDEKIKIYDKGVDINTTEGLYNLLVSYRSGDIYSPKVENIEALRVETQYFIDCINNNTKPFNDGMAGLRVVKMLEACNLSIKNNSKEIIL